MQATWHQHDINATQEQRLKIICLKLAHMQHEVSPKHYIAVTCIGQEM